MRTLWGYHLDCRLRIQLVSLIHLLNYEKNPWTLCVVCHTTSPVLSGSIIWIFTEGEGGWIKFRLPFKIFSTLQTSKKIQLTVRQPFRWRFRGFWQRTWLYVSTSRIMRRNHFGLESTRGPRGAIVTSWGWRSGRGHPRRKSRTRCHGWLAILENKIEHWFGYII